MTILDAKENKPNEGGASFSLQNRVVRLLWQWTWTLLASWTPAPFHRYRVTLVRLFGGDIHPNAHIYGSAKIWLPSNLKMGSHSCLGPRVNCYCMGQITIGEGAIVSQDVSLCAGSHDIQDRNFQLITKPIEIGANAWIAAEAFIGPGATIGEASVIGARAVVFGQTKPNGVYAGNPAKWIRQRFAPGDVDA